MILIQKIKRIIILDKINQLIKFDIEKFYLEDIISLFKYKYPWNFSSKTIKNKEKHQNPSPTYRKKNQTLNISTTTLWIPPIRSNATSVREISPKQQRYWQMIAIIVLAASRTLTRCHKYIMLLIKWTFPFLKLIGQQKSNYCYLKDFKNTALGIGAKLLILLELIKAVRKFKTTTLISTCRPRTLYHQKERFWAKDRMESWLLNMMQTRQIEKEILSLIPSKPSPRTISFKEGH